MRIDVTHVTTRRFMNAVRSGRDAPLEEVHLNQIGNLHLRRHRATDPHLAGGGAEVLS
jgi:hypothetical protein